MKEFLKKFGPRIFAYSVLFSYTLMMLIGLVIIIQRGSVTFSAGNELIAAGEIALIAVALALLLWFVKKDILEPARGKGHRVRHKLNATT